MLVDYSRERLINSIVYFANNVKYCGKVKLFKLLYFLDFEHFKEIGLSVTGLEYYAWQMGPVPKNLHQEIDHPLGDFLEAIAIEKRPLPKGEMMLFKAKKEFSKSFFSKRQLRIMESLVNKYRDTKAENIIEDTHLENRPWHQIYVVQHREKAHIPYELALRNDNKEEMLQMIKEREEAKSLWANL